jgi:hypothetical protein
VVAWQPAAAASIAAASQQPATRSHRSAAIRMHGTPGAVRVTAHGYTQEQYCSWVMVMAGYVLYRPVHRTTPYTRTHVPVRPLVHSVPCYQGLLSSEKPLVLHMTAVPYSAVQLQCTVYRVPS